MGSGGGRGSRESAIFGVVWCFEVRGSEVGDCPCLGAAEGGALRIGVVDWVIH